METVETLSAPQGAPSLRVASFGFLISTAVVTALLVLLGGA
jgi:hypothetical protein